MKEEFKAEEIREMWKELNGEELSVEDSEKICKAITNSYHALNKMKAELDALENTNNDNRMNETCVKYRFLCLLNKAKDLSMGDVIARNSERPNLGYCPDCNSNETDSEKHEFKLCSKELVILEAALFQYLNVDSK